MKLDSLKPSYIFGMFLFVVGIIVFVQSAQALNSLPDISCAKDSDCVFYKTCHWGTLNKISVRHRNDNVLCINSDTITEYWNQTEIQEIRDSEEYVLELITKPVCKNTLCDFKIKIEVVR